MTKCKGFLTKPFALFTTKPHLGMIHLITVTGPSAKSFYLDQSCLPDFKSLMRTVTSGRVMIISTKFRSDLFYSASNPENEAILKLWALYAKVESTDIQQPGFITSIGAEESLSNYFQAINKLSSNWHHYTTYQKAFYHTFRNDQDNPVAKIVMQCDQHLAAHPSIKRSPLISPTEEMSSNVAKDTFALAMKIINNDTNSN